MLGVSEANGPKGERWPVGEKSSDLNISNMTVIRLCLLNKTTFNRLLNLIFDKIILDHSSTVFITLSEIRGSARDPKEGQELVPANKTEREWSGRDATVFEVHLRMSLLLFPQLG